MTEPATLASAELHATGAGARDLAQRRRAIVALLAAVVVAGVVASFFDLAQGERTGRQRSSLSARADGFLGLHEVLARLGMRVTRQRASYGQLPPPQRSTLLAIDPVPAAGLETGDARPPDEAQARALRTWVEAGGQLVVALPGRDVHQVLGIELGTGKELVELPRADPIGALLVDLPARTWTARAHGEVDLWTVRAAGLQAAQRERWMPPRATDVERAPAHLRQAGSAVETLVFGEPTRKGIQVVATCGGHPLVLREARGEGALWVCASPWPFTNLALARHGSAPFVAALLQAASTGRTLCFDEYCHGLALDRGLLWWVLHTALVWPVLGCCLFVVLLGWRGALRLGPPRAERTLPRRAKEEFVIGLADIAERAGRHRGAARALLAAHTAALRRARPGAALPPAFATLQQRLDAATFGAKDLAAFATEAAAAYRDALQQNTEEVHA